MAIEPKTPRKRAVKKTSAKAEATTTDVISEEPKKATRKKAAVPVPVFQAAPDKPVAKAPRKKAEAAPDAPAAESASDNSDRPDRNRRRRRGGRGRRKPGAEGAVAQDSGSEVEEESADAAVSYTHLTLPTKRIV